ncbi:polysaccharide deacetylase family protein [Desulfofundulus thermosubterraneus]|uniref:Biofilm PGA synthesis lipoprotein PgaB n=1 Tax=Desulfofundulus thermosubterraneus DSM 16057 TaxID=1121432 RepID=A0A1M6KCS6_9FIRM|nr:polysaccharide deacetylase family protein [Desulfofundulus thermosubterraneus]SHJ56722.1 biofilm PGA synthesis lipoprotein PgaB [Desulfofundulus thermosubterraneus DSM 16057]
MNLLGMIRTLLLLFTPGLIPLFFPTHSSTVSFHPGYQNRVAVLMYHHISNTDRGPAVITPRLFRAHLDILQKEGYHVISTERLARFLSGKDTIPPKAVVITFDDGYESFYTYAYPELKKRNIPATCFVIVKSAGDTKGSPGSRHIWKQIPKLTWEQMREMQAHGMSFYPHSYDSHYLARFAPGVPAARHIRPALAGPIWLDKQNRRETQGEYEARVRADLLKAKEVMEKELGRPMDQFCWPYGVDSPTAARIARSLGYRYLYYTRRGLNGSCITGGRIRRINAGSPDITPEILIRKIEQYALLAYAQQWCPSFIFLDPALLEPACVALEFWQERFS